MASPLVQARAVLEFYAQRHSQYPTDTLGRSVTVPAAWLREMHLAVCETEGWLPASWRSITALLHELGCGHVQKRVSGKVRWCWVIPVGKLKSTARENVFELPRRSALGPMAGNMRSQNVASRFVASASC